MCGIVGFNWDDRILLKRMADSIVYRGPDDKAYYSDKKISLGMRRLSIIDLKKNIYPLTNEKNTIFVIFNGEIYNFIELRESLMKKGHRFKTECDGETIVHAYEEYGENFVDYLNGMFAIALFDSSKNILFLVRDRIGIKPLYYYFNSKKLVFASEIKSILQFKSIKREMNNDALNNYLSLRYNPLEETFFKGIKRLLPGHLLRFDLKNNNYSIRKYWDITIGVDSIGVDNKIRNLKYYEDKLNELFKDSVKKMLISDVPLGVYLSGGLDSSAIVSVMHELNKEERNDAPIRTYNVSFKDGEKVNESVYAKKVSDLFNTEHREFLIEPKVVDMLPKIIWHTDEPMADPALIPLHLLSEASKKTSTVVLTGDGGDELFAGYEHHRILKAANLASKTPLFKTVGPLINRSIPLSVWNKFHKYASDLGKDAYLRADELILNIKDDKSRSYYALLSVFSDSERRQLLSEDYFKEIDYASINKEYFANRSEDKFANSHGSSKSADYIQKLLLFDTKRMLPESFLMKTDRMTLANSVESRVPFLDHRLVEFAFKIPSNYKLNGIGSTNSTKYILKRSLLKKMPQAIRRDMKDIIYRKKQSFNMPIENWLNTDLRDMIDESFNVRNLPKMIQKDYILKIMNNYSSGKLYYARQLWSILTFSIWHRLYIVEEKANRIKI